MDAPATHIVDAIRQRNDLLVIITDIRQLHSACTKCHDNPHCQECGAYAEWPCPTLRILK